MAFGASWKTLTVPEDCPWRVYTTKVAKKHNQLIILPRRNTAAFLADMPDDASLASLLLPGTHDTMAFYGWPISQCQSPSTPLTVQLHSGIRVLDIRLAVINGVLIAYHGIYPQKTPFKFIMSTIRDFLASPESCKETIVMSMKQEDYPATRANVFSKTVHDEMMAYPDMWFLENRVPKLGEVRGKVVFLSRFGGNGDGWDGGLEGLGIHPTTWPDSAKDGFTWNCKNTLVRTHDWYAIPSFLSIPEKVALSTQILLPPPPPPAQGDIDQTLSITFFSAAAFPLAMPPTIAQGFGWPKWGLGVEGVNSRVGKWLLDMVTGESEEVRLRGWALMDYFADPEPALVSLLVECNYRGRTVGEEGF
ncbi:PLC-like phosphodiesterase [Mucidula mucida]|nr:PLC-like phosphodiesterase [Mucidula mucida]